MIPMVKHNLCHWFVLQRGVLLRGEQFILVVYSVGEVMSDLFGLEDASDFLEGWCVQGSASIDYTMNVNCFCIFSGKLQYNNCV